MTLDEADWAALEYAERSCLCVSYYSYQCGRCRSSAEGKAPDVTAMVDAGFVTWEGYGSPNLTEAGRKILNKLRSPR